MILSGVLFWNAFPGTSWSAEKTYTKDGLTISFPRMINITDDNHEELEGELSDLEIDHPVKINEAFTRNHLLSLWYQWVEPPGKPRPVFTTEEANRLSRLFRSALRKVRPEQYIHFEFQSEEGITEGEVFGSFGKLHWRFIRIHGNYFINKFLGLSDPTWKLVRKVRGQRLRVEKTALMKVTRENWIIADIQLPAPRPRPKTPASPPPPVRKKTAPDRDHEQPAKPTLNVEKNYDL